MKSLNADTANTAANTIQLGGVAASEFVQTTDPRMSDARDPRPGSGDYIQNQNSSQQTANFYLNGTGRALTFDVVTYQSYSGFWNPASLAPTAATVTVSGRVRKTFGRGTSNAVVSLTDWLRDVRSTRTTPFGYFRFGEVRSGESYVLTIMSRRYIFEPSSHLVMVTDNVSGIEFVASP